MTRLASACLLLSLLPIAALGQQPAPAAPSRPADIAKAVDCAILSQQYGDAYSALTDKTAKQPLDPAIGKAATERATTARKACMEHEYDTGLAGFRQALEQLGKKAIL